jgi:hypothetical protein
VPGLGFRGQRPAFLIGQIRKDGEWIDRAFGGGFGFRDGGVEQPKRLTLGRCQTYSCSRQMPGNPVEQLVLSTSRLGQLLDKEADLEFDRIGGNRLDQNRRGGCLQDQPSIQDGMSEGFGPGRRGGLGIQLDGHGDAVNS